MSASSNRKTRKPVPVWQKWVMTPGNWWLPLLFVTFTGVGSLLFVGSRTYTDAPPRVDMVTDDGRVIISERNIINGQVIFLQRALMEFGSMFGDGAGRGPDFTADALHQVSSAMQRFYRQQLQADQREQAGDFARDAVRSRVQRELKQNRHDAATAQITLSLAQVYAFEQLKQHYRDLLLKQHRNELPELQDLSAESMHDLAAFFFWGAWVSAAERPGASYSYTNNWPFDPDAGNTAPEPVLFWSVIGTLGLMLGLGAVLFLHGRFAELVGWKSSVRKPEPNTLQQMQEYQPIRLQLATYKFFWIAALLFLMQVFAGVLTVHNFLGLNTLFGWNVSEWLPLTVVRSWHLQLALLWITACWIGASIFLLATFSGSEIRGQLLLTNILFCLIVFMTLGNLIGILLAPTGILGSAWNLLGNQGWEFVEMGKLWQALLMLVLLLWALILFRGIAPAWKKRRAWQLPNWLLYTVTAVSLLFLSGFVATPETNFVIADFWRWAVIHMWVEAFFEVFATILVAYFMYLMGFVSHQGASRVVYIAALLFLGSGLLGISHNFYWNAKPMATLAVGSIFSTLQVVPLILLTLEAWQFRKLPADSLVKQGVTRARYREHFGQSAAFLFLLGVNFWNFLGAGVFGFIINLPIVNYYEHGTYLTVNHGHAAFMGVYGNLSLAAMLFCARYLLPEHAWPPRLLRRAFWSLNIGLLLMVALDLFPVGFDQLRKVMEHGYWYARSDAYIQGKVFQTLTWARISGGLLFIFGGVLPVAWFMSSRMRHVKRPPGEHAIS
ncbi:nitric-oxide reductase large subunit [Seongchinamella sediminis]|nr:cbb3-type cytochrome c oxidase subunit I [Seongchinamella sediminis]